MKARRSPLFFLILVLVGVGAIWVWKAHQQEALDRQLIAALVNNDSQQAITLLNAGADPNARFYPTPTPPLKTLYRRLLRHSSVFVNHSPTALMYACGAGAYLQTSGRFDHYHGEDLPLIDAMLAHGAKVNFGDSLHESAFYYAATEYRPHIAQLLLEHGANVNQKDSLGATPLMRVAYSNDTVMARLLLEHGANICLEDKQEQTALYYAVFAPSNAANMDVVRLLLAHGADPTPPNKFGATPLHLAQQRNRPDLVELLRGRR